MQRSEEDHSGKTEQVQAGNHVQATVYIVVCVYLLVLDRQHCADRNLML